MAEFRRVVTGCDDQGRSIITEDEVREAGLIPGSGYVLTAWSANDPASYPDGKYEDPKAPGFFPPVGGVRLLMCEHPPEGSSSGAESSVHDANADIDAVMEEGRPGFHATDTTDFIVMVSGETTLELDDGTEVVLKEGDIAVQNGTRHRWRNHSDVPATIAIFMVGANRSV